MANQRSAVSAASVAAECQAIARRHVEIHGWKRGLYQFGRAIDGCERRARAIYSGEARRIEAHEYLLAREADIALRQHERAALRARMDQIDAELRGSHVTTDGMGPRSALAMAGAAR